jgi:transposase-like protein
MRVPGSLRGPSHPGRVTREGCVANLRYNLDFLLTEHRDEQAAKRFLTKATRRHGVPEKITIDRSGSCTCTMRVIP